MRLRTALSAAAVAGLLLPPAAVVTTTAAASVTRSSTADVEAVNPGSVVTLLTGDRVSVSTTPDGRPSVTVLPDAAGEAATPDRSVQVLVRGDDVFAVPAAAAGYVGRPLDLGLFEVGADSAPSSTWDVQLGSGHGLRALPGTEVTGSSSLTLTDPAAFGRALASDSRTLARTGEPGDLFAGIRRVSPEGSSRPVPPEGALHTLTVVAFDRDGKRVNGDLGTVTSADDVEAFLAGQSFYRGTFSFSVPTGTYSLASYVGTTHADGTVDFTLVTDPEVRVTRDTRVVLDARKAVPVRPTVPRAADQVIGELNLQRDSATGVSFLTSFTTFGDTALYATPTEDVSVGELHFYPYLRLGDAAGGLDDYLYDIELPYHGAVPADLSPALTDSDLATVHTDYHSPVPGRAELSYRQGLAPWQAALVGSGSVVAAPATRVEYVTPHPDLVWLEFVALDEQTWNGMLASPVRAYQPGGVSRQSWAGQPMAPGFEQQHLGGQACPACRSGDSLGLMLFPFTDADGHFMLPDPDTAESLALYQDGTQVAAARSGWATLPLSPEPASYRLVYDVTRDLGGWPTSTAVHSEWSFRSSRQPADQLPPGWTCGGKGKAAPGGGGGSGECSFAPLLTASYTTNGGVDDVVPAGETAVVDVSVGHQYGATFPGVDGFAADVSFDDGSTWSGVDAERVGSGRYRLAIGQPDLDATSGFASLRIRAVDEDGNSLDQTITRAWPLTVPAPAAGLPSDPEEAPAATCSGPVRPPYTRCFAMVDPAVGVSLAEPQGLAPADIQSAYGLDPAAGAGRTVAIVAAYDNPNAEADLAVYREQYGLPPCTTANGCFRKVNQRGEAADLPDPNAGWALEISLDLDSVSAACPSCRILLVEADSASLADLIPAVHTAVRLGADVVSNSYGSIGEFSGEQELERYYRGIDVPVVVASGDYGYGNGRLLVGSVSYPAASRYAVAVGGTSLVPDGGGWIETAWSGATSGCSAYIRKPAWQQDGLCGMRTVADVSAVSDPQTGLAVYDTFGYDGWVQVGGTSLAAPVVSGIYAMSADTPAAWRYAAGLYDRSATLRDVVAGSNGECGGVYLCTAVEGYDGPTGVGTPDGGLSPGR